MPDGLLKEAAATKLGHKNETRAKRRFRKLRLRRESGATVSQHRDRPALLATGLLGIDLATVCVAFSRLAV